MKGRMVLILLALSLLLCACGSKEAEKTEYFLALNGMELSGTYTGAMEGNQPHGKGKFTGSGLTYEGEWSEGVFTGSGAIKGLPLEVTLAGTDYTGTYTGQVKDGIPNGSGTFLTEGDLTCQGEWLDGAPEGPILVTALPYTMTFEGAKYTGIYDGSAEAGLPSGTGSFSSEDSAGVFTYEGSWTEGQIAGEGTISYPNCVLPYEGYDYKGHYTGQTLDGKPQGQGVFAYENGASYLHYEGLWEAGAFAGEGMLRTDHYVMHLPEGNRTGSYDGATLVGFAAGEGTFQTETETYTGQWAEGLWNGQGKLKFSDPEALPQTGTFTAGVFTPTPYELMQYLSAIPDAQFSITNAAAKVLQDYPKVFKNHILDDSGLEITKDFSYGNFSKDPEGQGPTIMARSQLKINRIDACELGDVKYSRILAKNAEGDRNYYIYIYGHYENLKVGKTFGITGLAMDYFTYKNAKGQDDWALACAGILISD